MMHIVSLFHPRISPFLFFISYPQNMLLDDFRLEASSAGVILQSTSETSENGKPQRISSEVGVSAPRSSPIATATHTKKVYFLYPEIWEVLSFEYPCKGKIVLYYSITINVYRLSNKQP